MPFERGIQTKGRDEDERLLTGTGRYAADIMAEGAAHAVFVRSPHSRGRLLGFDLEDARVLPGVVGIYTAEDLARDGIVDLPTGVSLSRGEGAPSPKARRPFLASNEVRHLGEPLALVVAETAAQAAEAAELVMPELDELPAVATLEEATAKDAPAVWPEAPDNVGFLWTYGDRQAVQTAIAGAAHVVRREFRISRVAASPLEPRAALGDVDEDGRLVLKLSHQAPFPLRDQLARDVFRVEPSKLRVIAPDVGGSFGMKLGVHPEEVLVLWAARHLGRPVQWICSRSEAFLADDHARDVRVSATLALDEDLTFKALDALLEVNIGSYLSSRSLATVGNVGGIAGVYRTPLIAAEVKGIMSHSVPTGPYRGAGRPEATFVIERLIDIAARQLGIDPFELRHRNLIPSEAMPYKTGLTFTYDCGDFARNMEKAAEVANLEGYAARRERSLERGMLRGLGISNPIEAAGGPYGAIRKDAAEVTITRDGTVTLKSGVMSTGQGLETAISRLVAEGLGVDRAQVRFVQGDTGLIAEGRGSGGSSALSNGGSATRIAVERVIEKGRQIAGHHLEAAAQDIEYADGRFTVVGTDRSIALAEVAALAEDSINLPEGLSLGLFASGEFKPEEVTFPNGCHICELEIDRETGRVRIVNYVAVEDIGNVLYPMLAHGQMQGGIVQGIGQALSEAIVYEQASGQLLTGSFNDYAMPIAAEMPSIQIVSQPVPTALNPLGVKGVGEAGTVGALSATINAVCDALAPLGIDHLEMPASPQRIWAAIHAAESGGRKGG